jgi:hypothetical protein
MILQEEMVELELPIVLQEAQLLMLVVAAEHFGKAAAKDQVELVVAAQVVEQMQQVMAAAEAVMAMIQSAQRLAVMAVLVLLF